MFFIEKNHNYYDDDVSIAAAAADSSVYFPLPLRANA